MVRNKRRLVAEDSAKVIPRIFKIGYYFCTGDPHCHKHHHHCPQNPDSVAATMKPQLILSLHLCIIPTHSTLQAGVSELAELKCYVTP